jgi:hypothetical protein
MATNSTLEVFGHLIPVARLTPMAQGIVARTGGSDTVRWAGFVWYRPQVERPMPIEEAATEREAA